MENLEHCTPSDLGVLAGKHMVVDVTALDERAWVDKNAKFVEQLISQNGVVLVRGLQVNGSKNLGSLMSILFGGDLLEYTYRSTPRTRMRGSIYTSSEYHSEESIGLHSENSYANRWPLRIGFYCIKPAEQGGCTPIADCRKVYESISREVVEKFKDRGLMYVRNYSSIDLPWREVFQTSNKLEVEDYCRKNRIKYEWLGEDLRTRQVNPAVRRHPVTGEWVWFNAAHMFHISNMRRQVREDMRMIFDESQLPRNVYYGNGDVIEDEVFDEIRAAYQENQLVFEWKAGDLLLLDNMLFAHGRQPFSGTRKVLVGMARDCVD